MRICNGYTYPTAWSRRAWLSLPPPTRGGSGDKKKRSGIISRQAKGTKSHSKDWVITLQRLSHYLLTCIESVCFSVPICFSFHTDGHGLSRFFSLCPELSNYRIFSFHTDGHGISRMFFFIPNYRIIEFFFFTRNVTDYHGCFSLSRIIELSNFSFSHGMSRIITDFLYPELSN